MTKSNRKSDRAASGERFAPMVLPARPLARALVKADVLSEEQARDWKLVVVIMRAGSRSLRLRVRREEVSS